jgi:serine/threonine protein kinase
VSTNRPPSVYVDDIFEEILALPEGQRDDAIEARCSGHPSLAAEVRGLLDAEARVPASPKPIRAGEKFGRYRLESCLGRGASASVWRAWDNHLQAWTALKLLRKEIGQRPDALQNVLHEARAASAIISDHVIRIKGAGKFPEGPFYVEMQLCAEHRSKGDKEQLVVGRTLAEETPKNSAEAARLVMEAARGAEAAHRVGVLHRDIKPANILLTPVSRRALVADFGLSTPHVYPEPSRGTPSTATITLHLDDMRGGTLVGTPSFMPPEQAWGETATRGNDVYALGATLYSLLAGRAPYQRAGDDGPRPALDVVMDVREKPPESIRLAAPHISAQLERIVNRAMHRNPERRYATAGDLAHDLQRYLADHTTSVDKGRPWLTVYLLMRRHSAIVGAGAVMMAMSAVFVVFVTALELRRASLANAVESAELRLIEAEDAADRADAIREQAESARNAALEVRNAAMDERDGAFMDRDRAKAGQSKAEMVAKDALEAQKDAEVDALAAENSKRDAQHTAEQEAELRIQLAEALEQTLAHANSLNQQLNWLDGKIKDETTLRMNAESARDQAVSDLNLLAEEVLRLRSEIARVEAAPPTPEPATDAGTAPWMNVPVDEVELAPVVEQ